MKLDNLKETIVVPEGIQVEVTGRTVLVKGPKGELTREFKFPKVFFKMDNGSVVIDVTKPSKREKALVFTLRAHLKNMFKGVTEQHTYKLKICAGHFPMNVSLSGDKFQVKNFLGEKIPRVLKIKEGVKVKVADKDITVVGCDKEIAGQVAADIEQLCRITNRDIRIFQDGIYIVEKA